MKEQRRLVRLNVADFLDIRAADSQKVIRSTAVNITSMGICFSSQDEWQKGQTLTIYYFMPDELDSVQLTVRICWTEFINPKQGYFCGGEILSIEEDKQEKFIAYYTQRLEDRLSR